MLKLSYHSVPAKQFIELIKPETEKPQHQLFSHCPEAEPRCDPAPLSALTVVLGLIQLRLIFVSPGLNGFYQTVYFGVDHFWR